MPEVPVDGEPPRVLSTARLLLRPPVVADADEVFALTGDPRTVEHNPSDLLVDPAEADTLVRAWIDHWDRHGFGYWCVHDRGGGPTSFLGVCGIKTASLHSTPVLNLLYRFVPGAWGHGYATEAARAVVSWAHAHAPARPVTARVRPANVASARVAIKAGLTRAPWLDAEGEDGPDLVFTADG